MIAVVVGTRPELIKTAPVVKALERLQEPLAIIHTGQHYSESLDEIFFRELGLPRPIANLAVGSRPPVDQLAAIISGVGHVFANLSPAICLVQGDTNSVLGGALAAHKLSIPVAHLEAGLRSGDWEMPEEGNRVLTGHLAALHFCPTHVQRDILRCEGISHGVHVVGNTVVDATLQYGAQARASEAAGRYASLGRYALVTLHRPSNVDDPERLRLLVDALAHTADELGLRLVFPAHPRTRARLDTLGGSLPQAFVIQEPVGYIELLAILGGAEVVMTDSGGLQEEACSLGVPCVTLRDTTERPETVMAGANRLCASAGRDHVLGAARSALDGPKVWPNPLGDGKAGKRVAEILRTATTGSLLPSHASRP